MKEEKKNIEKSSKDKIEKGRERKKKLGIK